jgi:hypothetical protein
LEVAVDRLALFFRALVERFGPHAEWEHPYYPSEARLTEYREFLTAFDNSATIGTAAQIITWAMEGKVHRFEEEVEDAVAASLCRADALAAGFITEAYLPVSEAAEGHTLH